MFKKYLRRKVERKAGEFMQANFESTNALVLKEYFLYIVVPKIINIEYPKLAKMQSAKKYNELCMQLVDNLNCYNTQDILSGLIMAEREFPQELNLIIKNKLLYTLNAYAFKIENYQLAVQILDIFFGRFISMSGARATAYARLGDLNEAFKSWLMMKPLSLG